MKKQVRKFLCIALAASMLLSATACGTGDAESVSGSSTADSSSSDSGAATSDPSESAEPSGTVGGSFDKYDEVVKVTAANALSATAKNVDFQMDLWHSQYLEAFNIDLEYVFQAPQDQYDQRVSLMLSTGDIPDMMTVSLIQMQQMIEADLLEPQTEAWANLASDQAKEAMMTNGSAPFDLATVDGELYGIPWVQPSIETCHALFVNEKWRIDLDLPEPDTWENFEELIYGFKEKDANGNGQADEFGLGLSKNIWELGFEATSVANAHGAYPDAWIEKDGQVVYGSIQPEMKPALEKLAQYYADGLIDPEFIVKSYEQEAELVVKEQLGAMFGIQWTGLMGTCLQSLYKNSDDPDSLNWKVYPIPSTDGNPAKPIVYDNTSKFVVIRKGFEHPDIPTKLVNYMHFLGIGPQEQGPEGRPDLAVTQQQYNGDTGADNGIWSGWAHQPFAGETIHANIQRWTSWFKIIEDDDQEAAAWCANNLLAKDTAVNIVNFEKDGSKMVNALGETGIETPSWQFTYNRCGETFMYALDCEAAGNLVTDIRGAFVSETMVEKWASLESLELQEITKIITGESPIDAFDTFVANWQANGGETITQEMNEFYNNINS